MYVPKEEDYLVPTTHYLGSKICGSIQLSLCLGGFCTSTRTSCQALDSPLIFWFLPQEKLQID